MRRPSHEGRSPGWTRSFVIVFSLPLVCFFAAVMVGVKVMDGQALPSMMVSTKVLKDEPKKESRLIAKNTYDPVTASYPWLTKDRVIVEPHKVTRLNLMLDTKEHTVDQWKITSRGTNTVEILESNEYTFLTVGEYLVVAKTKANEYYTFEAVCRYVRREIRSLSENDREAYFKATEVIYKEAKDHGLVTYGQGYKDVVFFVELHNRLAGTRDCDHLHDGLGFLGQHAAFTLTFEKVLQVINPSLTVPYWDYTIESRAVNSAGGDTSVWRESVVFSDDWFGNAQPSNKILDTGRWAYTPVTGSAWNLTNCNAYGLMRAPWNLNKIPFVTRYNKTYGYSLSDVPSCTDHYSVMQETSWIDFGIDIQYNAHGTVHAMIGGVWGADYATFLQESLNMRKIPSENIALEAFATQKNLWRGLFLECPSYCDTSTPAASCGCRCPLLEKYYAENRSAGILQSVSPIFFDDKYLTDKRNNDVSDTLLALLCNEIEGYDPRIGDSLESASPLDPSFYPTHPTLDRLYHWRRILGFENDEWVDNQARSVPYADVGYCWGHNADDVLIWQDLFDFPQHPEVSTYKDIDLAGPYTNAQLWQLFDPTSIDAPLPYIYDSFSWPHCAEEGYPLSLVGATNNTAFSGKAGVDEDSLTNLTELHRL